MDQTRTKWRRPKLELKVHHSMSVETGATSSEKIKLWPKYGPIRTDLLMWMFSHSSPENDQNLIQDWTNQRCPLLDLTRRDIFMKNPPKTYPRWPPRCSTFSLCQKMNQCLSLTLICFISLVQNFSLQNRVRLRKAVSAPCWLYTRMNRWVALSGLRNVTFKMKTQKKKEEAVEL